MRHSRTTKPCDFPSGRLDNQRGAVLVLVAVLLVTLLGVAAFAVDYSHLMVVRAELQNAADAGALAGAYDLFVVGGSDDGRINPDANASANLAALSNFSENLAVEVHDPFSNSGDVQRGHWNLATRTFTASDSLEPTTLWGVSEADLDAMDGTVEFPPGSGTTPVFVNAVRVVARRDTTQAQSFFARIFDFTGFSVSAEAVAYIGFAGSLAPGEAQQPIAICMQSIMEDGVPQCNMGRMINSGGNEATSNTGGWTSFAQDETCSAASVPDLRPLVCGAGNPEQLRPTGVTATGGDVQTVFNAMRDCWLQPANSNDASRPWSMTLPVVDCVGNNVGNCPVVVGAVTVELLWMTEAGTAQPEDFSITAMADDWDFNAADQCADFKGAQNQSLAAAMTLLQAAGARGDIGQGFDDPGRWQGQSVYSPAMARWDCFVNHFGLKNVDDAPAPLAKKSMYFSPDCSVQERAGNTGGLNFGVLARIPALVR